MKNIRIGNDITAKWTVLTNGEAAALEGRDLDLLLVGPYGEKTELPYTVEDTNVLKFAVFGTQQKETGEYRLELWENKGGIRQAVADECKAFSLVPLSCEGTADLSNAILEIGPSDLKISNHGLSAYEIAVAHGFEGSEEEWLDSLKLKYPDLTEDEIKELQKPAQEMITSLKKLESEAKTSEETRTTAEALRETNEKERKEAETSRQEAETSRNNAETQRIAAEKNRETAEASRVAAETERDKAETSRAENEKTRTAAESVRDKSESLRESAELERKKAETERISQEENRKIAENQRAKDFAAMKSAIETSATKADLAAENAIAAASKSITAAAKAENAASKAASDVKAFTEAGTGTINDTVAAAKSQINAAVQQAGTAASGAETAASEANKAAQDANEQLEAMKGANYVKAGEGVETARKATISINGKSVEVLSPVAGELAKLFAPETAGAEGQILLAGDGKPQWADPRAAMRPVYESYGAVYNAETECYELNGLTDITEEQMLGIYNASMAAFNGFSQEGTCHVGLRYARTIRTVLDKYHDRPTIWSATYMRFNAFAALQQCSALETVVLGNETYAVQLAGGWSSMFNGCVKLRTLKWLDFSFLSGVTDGLEFNACSKLAEVRIKGVRTDLSFKDNPLVDYESWEYMIGNAMDGIGITLTVHPDTYSYLAGTATPPEAVGGTSEQWQALVTAASAKQISFATAE